MGRKGGFWRSVGWGIEEQVELYRSDGHADWRRLMISRVKKKQKAMQVNDVLRKQVFEFEMAVEPRLSPV